MPESLYSTKLNQTSSNQNYLRERKLSARMRKRDVSSGEVIDRQENDLILFSEYREFTTSSEDDGRDTFSKRFRLPSNLFASGVMPVSFVKLGYHGNSITTLNQVVKNPTPNGVTIVGKTGDNNEFEENMDYFANILMISPSSTTPQSQNFVSVDFGQETESLRISSLALNQLAENSNYINHYRVKAVLRNVNYISKNPDFYMRYLNDNLAIYGHYEEFLFEEESRDYNADKNDTTDEEAPKKFIRYFEFPDKLFAAHQQPTVIYNIGAKVISEPGTEIRMLTSILKNVNRRGFKLEIREHSSNASFASNQMYFCSYIAMAERQNYD